MTDLEKMARAIHTHRYSQLGGSPDVEVRGKPAWHHTVGDALAALKAIPEPSEEMMRAVFDTTLVPAGDFVPAWRAAIRHIIAQGEAG